MKNKIKIILFGGNRLLEDGPIGDLIDFLKKKKINFFLITDPIHLKKKIFNGTSFREQIKSIKHLSFKKLNDKKILQLIDNKTYGISINSVWKFSALLISKFNGRLFNYHAANLPQERGAANLTWKILQKDFKKNTINIHKVDVEFDTGHIASSKKINFPKKDLLPKDYLKIIRSKENFFLINFIKKILKQKKIVLKKQNGDQYYWPRLNANKDGKIDWSWDVEDIVLFIKGFSYPYSGAFSFIFDNKIKIFDANFVKKKKFHPFQNGLIFRENNREIFIANKTGYIVIKKDNIKSEKVQKKYLGKKFL